jgi:NADH-quinone oxidoreductase subunit H
MSNYIESMGQFWGPLMVLGQIGLFTLVLLLSIAFLLLLDRKIWAGVQMRRKARTWSVRSACSSLLRTSEVRAEGIVIPAGANKFVFLFAPILTCTLAFAAWSAIPAPGTVSDGWVMADINVGILYLFAISSLGVYGIIMGGWASNSKYPFLGALRSAAQMVSYEVSIGFVIVTVLLMRRLLNLTDIVWRNNQDRRFLVLARLSFQNLLIAADCRCSSSSSSRPWLKRTVRRSTCRKRNPNWSPVTMVEYSAPRRTCCSCSANTLNIVLMCAMMTILFLGGWLPPIDVAPFTWVPGVFWFMFKTFFVFFMFSMVKAIVPRYRYDQLMRLGWKVFLPTSLFWVADLGWLVAFDCRLSGMGVQS